MQFLQPNIDLAESDYSVGYNDGWSACIKAHSQQIEELEKKLEKAQNDNYDYQWHERLPPGI
jgi:hypothetical protein